MSSDQDAEQQPNFETIAVLDFGSGTLDTAFSSKLMAIRWFKRWMTTLDCSLQRNLQFKTLSLEKNGWSLKVRLHHMQASDLDRAVEAFSQLTGAGGSVQIMSDESVAGELLRTEIFKQKKNKQAGDCGDFAKTAAVVDRLSQYFGRVDKKGQTKKQKRCALAASELLNRSHLVGSSGLREARVEDEDEEEHDH